MDVWFSMIRDVGFPAVVTFFLLYRIEGKLDELIRSVQALPVMQAATESAKSNFHQAENQ
ncbi:MAG: YvrJ family protein [Sporolactobacillus sp.]|jgi:hypothetical protein|nr:YvrJ family protein [Sporolactobacillus sp.]